MDRLMESGDYLNDKEAVDRAEMFGFQVQMADANAALVIPKDGNGLDANDEMFEKLEENIRDRFALANNNDVADDDNDYIL
jgi:predicted metal-dependent HD superfamily phosphohydrolase